ncbi:N-acetyl-gamma-glutamyl-phosphate reductase [Alteripontixanthobacter maritimus]|uniref:N-acetyl-gamma-glutamyl-phosphate reductase n=1 Tax=Alteripontixanthobacter maritimus TaxID=2161824 RepID=A0A369Q7R5_9SPHN|nr:N-acetyl-gamma-glutamyl-phosphate reductase [Alteripontixanthobacter maritimus]RDC59327.1 N-acetyl-gamma-glutamyl-phosphate reductase [Alteripontixanthobacter maritimus]
MTRVFIDGAAGTTGLEIHDRLAQRSEFELLTLPDNRRKDIAARREALNEADIAILCLPDDAAREAIALIDAASGTRVIDASSAYRTADGWTYGFPELVGEDVVANATRVSNPGCYPTGFLALVAPLVRGGLLPADWPYTVNAVSGYSGGGKALIERFEAAEAPAFRAYGYDLAHKHLPEMQTYAGLDHPVLFAPSVGSAFRGMIVEVPLHLGAMPNNPHSDQLRNALISFYDGSEVVTVQENRQVGELLLEPTAAPSDALKLSVFGNEGGWNARLVAQLDNLGKGASGAAVQNLNLMCGLPQTSGLRLSDA